MQISQSYTFTSHLLDTDITLYTVHISDAEKLQEVSVCTRQEINNKARPHCHSKTLLIEWSYWPVATNVQTKSSLSGQLPTCMLWYNAAKTCSSLGCLHAIRSLITHASVGVFTAWGVIGQ